FPIPAGGAWPNGTWPFANYEQDPGMKNPYLSATSLAVQPPPIQPPPIPPRRLFQIPDAYGSPVPYPKATGPGTVPTGAMYTAPAQAPQLSATVPPYNA